MMNERIKELEEQAYIKVNAPGCTYLEFSKEKFAELIVRECAELIDSKRELGLDPSGDYVKAHFGVEE